MEKTKVMSGFKTFAVFRMQSVFFWEFPRLLTFRRRGDSQKNTDCKSNENFKTTIPSKNYDRSKASTEYGIFLIFG